MPTVPQGSSIALLSQWFEYSGGPPAGVNGLTITITPIAAGAAVVGPTGTGISNPSTGVYTFTWVVPSSQPPGDYLATWSGIDSGGVPVSATETVTVLAVTSAGVGGPKPPLASVADLQAHLGRTLVPAQAEVAIRRASARVRAYTRQTLTFVANETIDVDGGDQVLRVPQRPLVVDATHPLTVVELGNLSAPSFLCVEERDYTRLGNELTRGYPWYLPTRLMGYPRGRYLGVWSPRVRITYSHGYTSVPDDVMDVVLDLATIHVTNIEGLRSESIDDYSRTYAIETVGSARLTRDHLAALRPYRTSAFSVRQT